MIMQMRIRELDIFHILYYQRSSKIFNQRIPQIFIHYKKSLLFSWRLRVRENVNSKGGYKRHLNDQRSRDPVTVTERGANLAVCNARESASVPLTPTQPTGPSR